MIHEQLAMACRRARASVIVPSVRHINIRVLDIEETVLTVTQLVPETVFIAKDGTPTSSDTALRARTRTVGLIQHMVADHFGIALLDMTSMRRTKDVIKPRHIAMYLARVMTSRPIGELSRSFHRDHATILFAVAKIRRLISKDPDFAAEIASLKIKIEEKTR